MARLQALHAGRASNPSPIIIVNVFLHQIGIQLTSAQITNQFAVLNEAFSGVNGTTDAGIQFFLNGTKLPPPRRIA